MLNTKNSPLFKIITLVFFTAIAVEIGLQIRTIIPLKSGEKNWSSRNILIIGDSVSSQYPQYLSQKLPNYHIETLVSPNASISEMKVRVEQLEKNYFLSIIMLGRFERDNGSIKNTKMPFLILPRYLVNIVNKVESFLLSNLKELNFKNNYFDEVEKFISSHQYQKAIPIIKNYLKKTDDLDAYATLAFCLIKSSKLEQASVWIKKGLTIDPDNTLLNIRYLELLKAKNVDYQKTLFSILEMKPKHHDFYYLLMQEIQNNSNSTYKNQILNSLDEFFLFTKKNLQNIHSLEFYLNFLLHKKDYENFKLTLYNINSKQFMNPRIIELVTKYYISLNNFELALAEIKKLKNINLPKHLLEVLFGDIRYSQGFFDEAEKHYNNSLMQEPSLSVIKKYAITLKINEKFDDSLKQFEKLIQIQPENLDFHLRYGECVFKSKKFNHGINFYTNNFKNKKSSYMHMALANFYIGLNNQAKSLEHLKYSNKFISNQEILSKTIERYQEAFNTVPKISIVSKFGYEIKTKGYKELIDLVQKKTKNIIILGYPDNKLNPVQDLKIEDKENIRFLSSYDLVEESKEKFLLSWDNLHFTSKGNQALANYLKKVILEIKN